MACIYIVEDDTDIREIEAIALRNSGHTVVDFVNGRAFSIKWRRRCRIWRFWTLCCRTWTAMRL